MTVLTAVAVYLWASALLMLAVKVWARATGRGCRPLLAWFDIWVGFYWDTRKRALYVFPVPMVGIVVQFAPLRLRAIHRTHTMDGTGYVIYRLGGRYIVHWSALTPEGSQMMGTINAMRAAVPGMTAKEAKELWDKRQIA